MRGAPVLRFSGCPSEVIRPTTHARRQCAGVHAPARRPQEPKSLLSIAGNLRAQSGVRPYPREIPHDSPPWRPPAASASVLVATRFVLKK